MKRTLSRLGLTAFALVAGGAVLVAQQATGALKGPVTSDKGAPKAGVTVTIVSKTTGLWAVRAARRVGRARLVGFHQKGRTGLSACSPKGWRAGHQDCRRDGDNSRRVYRPRDGCPGTGAVCQSRPGSGRSVSFESCQEMSEETFRLAPRPDNHIGSIWKSGRGWASKPHRRTLKPHLHHSGRTDQDQS